LEVLGYHPGCLFTPDQILYREISLSLYSQEVICGRDANSPKSIRII
jgi:hypothetical protein